jgi:hypothetical protein
MTGRLMFGMMRLWRGRRWFNPPFCPFAKRRVFMEAKYKIRKLMVFDVATVMQILDEISMTDEEVMDVIRKGYRAYRHIKDKGFGVPLPEVDADGTKTFNVRQKQPEDIFAEFGGALYPAYRLFLKLFGKSTLFWEFFADMLGMKEAAELKSVEIFDMPQIIGEFLKDPRAAEFLAFFSGRRKEKSGGLSTT